MQKYLVGFFIILSITLCVYGQDAPIPNSYRSLTRAENCGLTDNSTYKCLDCNSIQYCGSSGSQEYTLPCSAFPGKSFCSSGKTSLQELCTNTPDPVLCGPGVMGFRCPGTGLFPSVENCKDYYSCPAEGAPGTLFTCTGSYNYNHAARFCKLNTPCPIINCTGEPKIIPYPSINTLYIICRGKEKPILKACKANSIFNAQTLLCEFQCKSEGFFVDPESSSSFYMCLSNGKGGFEKLPGKCPDKQIFDEKDGYCKIPPVTSAPPLGGAAGSIA